jgi:hypothetical protein
MLAWISTTLLVIELGLLVAVWSDLSSVQKSVSNDPLAAQLRKLTGTGGYQPEQLLQSPTWTLLSLWLTLLLAQLLPQLYPLFMRSWQSISKLLALRKQQHSSTSASMAKKARAKQIVPSTTVTHSGSAAYVQLLADSMSASVIHLLISWVKVIVVAFIGWFVVMNATKLDGAAGKLSYATDTDSVFSAELARRSVTLLYLSFSYTLLSVICLWIQQNIGFIRIGKQMKG